MGDQIRVDADVHHHRTGGIESLSHGLQRTGQATAGDVRRHEVREQRAQVRGGDAYQVLDRAELLAGHGRFSRECSEPERRCAELLDRAVVQLAGNPTTLILFGDHTARLGLTSRRLGSALAGRVFDDEDPAAVGVTGLVGFRRHTDPTPVTVCSDETHLERARHALDKASTLTIEQGPVHVGEDRADSVSDDIACLEAEDLAEGPVDLDERSSCVDASDALVRGLGKLAPAKFGPAQLGLGRMAICHIAKDEQLPFMVEPCPALLDDGAARVLDDWSCECAGGDRSEGVVGLGRLERQQIANHGAELDGPPRALGPAGIRGRDDDDVWQCFQRGSQALLVIPRADSVRRGDERGQRQGNVEDLDLDHRAPVQCSEGASPVGGECRRCQRSSRCGRLGQPRPESDTQPHDARSQDVREWVGGAKGQRCEDSEEGKCQDGLGHSMSATRCHPR